MLETKDFIFYVGCHYPALSRHFDNVFLSVSRLWTRRKPVPAKTWILDSGAFTEINKHGDFIHTEEQYVERINFLSDFGNLKYCMTQDYIGLDNKKTVIRFHKILDLQPKVKIMPVLSGNCVADYIEHIKMYELEENAYIGVGALVPKTVKQTERILQEVKNYRADLQLHGLGVGLLKLQTKGVRETLKSSDSTSWSMNARRKNRDANGPTEGKIYEKRIYELFNT